MRPRRVRYVCAAAFCAALAPGTARADLRVVWDCYLPSSGIDCSLVESSLTSKIPFLRIVKDRHHADVVATITSFPAENGTRYRFDFVGTSLDGYTPEVHTTDKIPSSIDSTTAMVRVLTKIERGLDDFMDQKVVAEVKDGKLAIVLSDPWWMPYTGRPEQSSLKWYVTPSVGSYFSEVEGVGINASGTASLSYNYSERTWRDQQSIGVSYSRQSQPVAGTDETASIDFTGASATNVLSWALTRDNTWSVGVLGSAEKNPQANYTFRANASAGIEFDLVPRQTVNQKNFGFRCAIGPEFERYDTTNVEGIDEQLVGRQFCDVFLSWHFQPIDVGGSLGETSILEDFSYRAFSAGFSATWRLTDNLILAPWVWLQQINQAINEAQPVTTVSTDPRQEVEASMLAAVQQGYTAPFGIQSGVTIKYVFGNGSLAIEDQRWKGTTNLR